MRVASNSSCPSYQQLEQQLREMTRRAEQSEAACASLSADKQMLLDRVHTLTGQNDELHEHNDVLMVQRKILAGALEEISEGQSDHAEDVWAYELARTALAALKGELK